MALLATALTLVALNYVIRSTMHEMARQSLRSILDAKLTAFGHWYDQQTAIVTQAMQSPQRRSLAVDILTSHPITQSVSPEQLVADPKCIEFDQSVAIEKSGDTVFGWALVDIEGRVLCSDLSSLVAENLSIPSDSLERIISRQSALTRPFGLSKPAMPSGPMSQPEPVVIAAITPIVDGARTVGGFLYLMDPHADFTELLAAPVPDAFAHSYAIDRRGVMLTDAVDERSREQGHSAAIHSARSESTILSQVVHDPGGAELPESGSRPLTVLADQLTRGGEGENVVGYRDYRAVDVIGAWRWMPEYGFGVAVEMKVAEVYGPLRTLSLIHWVLAILLTLAAFALGTLRLYGPRISRSLTQNDTTRQLGKYKLGRLIGEGAMGSVYIGAHELLKREVAIKVLEKDELTSTAASRFAREVQLTAQLRHPNTIAIFDYGCTDDGTFYYVMEYIEGITLQELIDQYGRQSPGRVISLLIQMCGSLSEAHLRGIVHRDIKPANILLTEVSGVGDMIKVLDFGLVKEITRDTVELTRVDSITGTPMYMSPEAVRDASAANEQSDLYAVGAVGYALLAGVPVFEGGASVDICLKQLNELPVRPSDRTGIPLAEDLQNVLMSCLQKDPNQRPMSMDELADTLRGCEDHGRWTQVDTVQWWNHQFDGDGVSKKPCVSPASGQSTTANTRDFSG